MGSIYNNNNNNNFFSTIKSSEPIFSYYILFMSEVRERLQVISQMLVIIIDVLEVLFT